MIERLRGEVIEKAPGHVVVMTGGVGYGLDVPATTLEKLPPAGHDAELFVYTHVREEALDLYGFHTGEERAAFLNLMGVSGVGPSLALAILSGMPLGKLAQAIRAENAEMLSGIKGVGKKTAERLVLELKGKIKNFAWAAGASASPLLPVDGRPEIRDAIAALTGLGMKPAQAERAIASALDALGDSPTVEELVKEGLKRRQG